MEGSGGRKAEASVRAPDIAWLGVGQPGRPKGHRERMRLRKLERNKSHYTENTESMFLHH